MLSLSVLFLVAAISLPPRFFMKSSSLCIDASTLSWILTSPLPLSFLDAYSLSTLSLGCKTSCIVMSFFFGPFVVVLLWYTFRMVPSILRWGQHRYLCLWWDFCYLVWFWVVFSFSRGSLIIFPFICSSLLVSASNIHKYVLVSISPCVLIFSWFGSSIPSMIRHFLLFITCMAHFSMLNSIPISSLYILTARNWVSSSFSVHFLSIWLGGIIAITNSNSDRAFPRKIALWIFSSVKLFLPTFNLTLHGMFYKLYAFIGYLLYFEASCHRILPDNIIICLCIVNPCVSEVFPSCLALLWGYVDQCKVALLYLGFTCSILSVSRGRVNGLLANHISPL